MPLVIPLLDNKYKLEEFPQIKNCTRVFLFVCLFCLQSALKDSLESLQRSQLGQPGPKKEKERIIRLASKVAPKYTRVKQFLHAALKWS